MNEVITLNVLAEEACERVGFQAKHRPFKWSWVPPGMKEPYHMTSKDGHPGANKRLGEVFSKVRTIAEAPSFFLAGSVGCGKTGLLSAYCKVLFLNLEPKMSPFQFSQLVRYIQHDDLNDLFRDIENGRDGIDELTEIELLIIDELAAEKDTDWVLKELQRLIDRRWANNRPTWFASNHKRSDIVKCNSSGDPVLDKTGGLQCLWPGWERIAGRVFDRSWCRYAELTGNFRENSK